MRGKVRMKLTVEVNVGELSKELLEEVEQEAKDEGLDPADEITATWAAMRIVRRLLEPMHGPQRPISEWVFQDVVTDVAKVSDGQ